MSMKFVLVLLAGFLTFSSSAFADPDPNFYIFLCFGQSNMDGAAKPEEQDKQGIDPRFQVLWTINSPNLGRTAGNWYPAVPPLCRTYSGISPADYFGRTMVANLPASIRVGVINVSVPGCDIRLFNKDNFEPYAATAPDWMKGIIKEYHGNPYTHLVGMAKLAQKDGVIKGILFHQGETNTSQKDWPAKVKLVYDNLLKDLDLKPDSVPLLAGEVVNKDQGGACAIHNAIVAELPKTIPNSYVVSSAGCTAAPDHLHFNAAGYRELGNRYAVQMLSQLG
ncbi:MAG TPA: sialate O-acetylesterase [Chloroflexota bacterium]|nr:sialate O-acetylesterase [Chloroflexota bacterium]